MIRVSRGSTLSITGPNHQHMYSSPTIIMISSIQYPSLARALFSTTTSLNCFSLIMNRNWVDDRPPTASTNPNCHFESLAPELLFPIMTHLPDLESLHDLLRASPAAFRLFGLRGIEIFETILSFDSNIHEYTRALIRIVALLRSTALPSYVHDLISFKDLVRHETTSYRYNPARWKHPPSRLPPYTSTTALHEVVATNRRIQRLTFDCVQYYLDRFKSLRPSHLADEGFRYGSKNNIGDEDYVGPWQLKPAEILTLSKTLEDLLRLSSNGLLGVFSALSFSMSSRMLLEPRASLGQRMISQEFTG